MPRARLMILPAGHGDHLGEEIMSKNGAPCPEMTAALIEQFLDSPE